jgi:uracil phosphoribosyltransferase
MEIINFGEQKTLISQFMRQLRDKEIQKNRLLFRNNLERIGQIMAYEISKRLQYEQVEATTPLAVAKCNVISEKIVLGTILRAGLPFHQGFPELFRQCRERICVSLQKIQGKR